MTDSTPPPAAPEPNAAAKPPAPMHPDNLGGGSLPLPPGVILSRGRRALLVTWMLRLFLFFQSLAVLQGLLDVLWPTNFADAPALILGFSCLQNLSVIPLVLGVIVWLQHKTNRYLPAAKRLAKIVVAHFVLSLLIHVMIAVTLLILALAAAPDVLQGKDPSGDLRKAMARIVTDHNMFVRAGFGLVFLFEAAFLGLGLLCRRALQPGHYLPMPAPDTADDAEDASASAAAEPLPPPAAPTAPEPAAPPPQAPPPPAGPASPTGE